MSQAEFPPLPIETWQATRDTIKIYAQILGKIRRALTPYQKHWWHVSLRATAVGLTTTPIPAGDKVIELLLDFTQHHLLIISSHAERYTIPLTGQSARAFLRAVMAHLKKMGIEPEFDQSSFESDEPGTYEKTAVATFWQAMSQIDAAFKQFRHGFRQESSPVQLWPHHFDLAVVWFSGRLVPDQDPGNPEYADEQMNFGFSTGDSGIPEPYFYATAYPTPADFTQQALPDGAYWQTEGWTGGVLPYSVVSRADEPRALLLQFLRQAFEAGSQFMRV